MVAIVTREISGTNATVKNEPLLNSEIDNNFISINNAVETLVANSYTTEKGAVNGLATLDASGKITSTQLNTLINSIGGLSTAGLIGRTVAGAAEIISLTAAAKSLLDDNSITDIRNTLGLGTVATTDASAYQTANTTLAAIAALSSNGIIEKTGSGTAAIIAATAAGKAMITAADVAAQKLLLGIDASGNTYQPIDTDLTAIAALSETSSIGLINRTAGGITTVATSDFAPAAHVGATGSAHGVAVTGSAGFMSSTDKAKLDGISPGATANTGTVTSVSLSLPTEFVLTTATVNTSGTLTATKATQDPNKVFAGPAIGSTKVEPTFRALVAADIPALSYAPSSHVGATGSAHGVAITGTAGFMSSADKAKLDGIASGATANTGTVTSVTLSVPTEFSVSGSPITTSGTLTISKNSQTANQVFAAPNGSSGTPVFRALVAADIPQLAYTSLSGLPTLGTASAMTGPTSGTIVGITDTQTLSAKTLTGLKETKVDLGAGTAIDLDNGNCFTKTISANTTFSISHPPGSGSVGSFILELTNGAAYVITFWGGIKWTGGVVPTLTTSGIDILGFYTHDGGNTWRGLLLSKDSK